MRRTHLALVLACIAGIDSAARADEVDTLGGKVVELDARVHDLDYQLKPPAEPGPEIAERRLIDAQVLYELKNYEAASIILFDLVDKYPGSSAYPEGLYYLADSLYLQRDYLSSRRYFEKIVEMGTSNRRYQESLQRLIELSLHTGDYGPVDGYITKLEGLPIDRLLPSVPYVKGKYYFFRKQYDKSLAALQAIGPTNEYYFQSQYFVGAAQVAIGGAHLAEAIATYGNVLKTDAKNDAQKRIVELTHMALARIYLDRDQLTNALNEYSKLSSKSDLFNDALYESAWVSIRGKEYLKARRALDLLMLNAPDSSLAPEVKLLVGKLFIRQQEYGPATDMFSRTREEYQPIRKQLEAELAKLGDAKNHFRDLIAKNMNRFDTAAILPASVNRFMKDEAEVKRITGLVHDVGDLNHSLTESEEIVKRLEKTLNGPARVNVFPELAHMRANALDLSNQITEVKKKLVARESQLIAPVAGNEKAMLTDLQAQREALETKMSTMPGATEGVAEHQKKTRTALNDFDKEATESQAELASTRLGAQAVVKLYHDELEKKLPDAQRLLAQKELDDWMAQIDEWQKQLEDLRRDLQDNAVLIDDTDAREAAQAKAQYDDLLKRLHAVSLEVRSRLQPTERTKAEQIESILERSRGVDQKIAAFNARIDDILDLRLKDIQSELADEKAHVLAYRQQLNGYSDESSDVGGDVIADSFREVAQRFYNIVVRSDVGIIDVAWALKDSSTQGSNKLLNERKRELKLIDDEFKDVLKEQQ